MGWVCRRPDYPGVMAGRRGPPIFRISPSAWRTVRAGRRAWRPGSAGPFPASSSGAARGWAYAPPFYNGRLHRRSLPSGRRSGAGPVLTGAPGPGPRREKWQTLPESLPTLDWGPSVSMTTNFADRTIWIGDNLDILSGLNSASVDLIFLDSPFNSNRDYARWWGGLLQGQSASYACPLRSR